MHVIISKTDICHRRTASRKIVLRDLDLLCEGHIFEKLIYLNRVELAKNAGTTCVNVIFATRMTYYENCTRDFDSHLKCKKCETLISWKR